MRRPRPRGLCQADGRALRPQPARPGEAAAVASRQFDELSRHFGGFAPGVSSPRQRHRGADRRGACALENLAADERVAGIRATQTLIGNAIEADFPIRVALAALAVGRRGFYLPTDDTGIELPAEAPSKILATSWGFWRGEGMALVEAAG